jgi:hypothetical protein
MYVYVLLFNNNKYNINITSKNRKQRILKKIFKIILDS